MKLLFVGDCMLGRLVNQVLKQKPPDYPWGDTLSVLKQANARFINLESVLSDHGRPWSTTPKVFHFRSDAKNIAILETAKINAVSLANNHILDYEYEAMFETISLLDKKNILHAGAGGNIEEASKPAFLNTGGTKIAFLAFTDNEPLWQATHEKPGTFFVPVNFNDNRAKRLFKIVEENRQNCHLLIISAHWGPNWGYRPPPNHIPFAHKLIDAGADIIYGHSCHVFQGIEIYKNRPILYSTGDFIDDYAVDEIERNDESFIFIVETEDNRITGLKLYPTLIKNFQARLALRERARQIGFKMQKLSQEFQTPVKWIKDKDYLKISIKP